MKNYKNIPLEPVSEMGFRCDDMIIILETEYSHFRSEQEEESEVNPFCVRAWIGSVLVGKINGLSTNPYCMLTDPAYIAGYLDSESAIYGDEALAYLERVFPQAEMDESYLDGCGLSDEEIEDIFDRMDDSERYRFREHNILFFNDVIVSSEYRRHGVFTKMMEVLKDWFGEDYSGAAYIYPVRADDQGEDLEEDEENESRDLPRNRMIAEKFGWSLADDFVPSATEHNAYALKLPEDILGIVKGDKRDDAAEGQMISERKVTDVLDMGTRVAIARKEHKCDWCRKKISIGEKYVKHTILVDGDCDIWRSHLACHRVSDAIWDYVDQYSRFDGDTFGATCEEVSRLFICPVCPSWNKERCKCASGNSFCIERMDEFFAVHELYAAADGHDKVWKCKKKKSV